jgi:DNA repair protein RAD5
MGKFRNMQAKSKKDQVTDEFLSQVANKLSDAAKSNSSQLEEECSICLEPISLNKSLVTPCLHMFCEDCLINFMKEKALSQAVKHEDDEEQKLPPRILSAIPSGPCPVCAENVNANKILRISQAEPGGEVKTSYLTESQASKARLLTNPNDDKARQVLENAIQGANSSKMGAILSELHNIWEEEAGSKVLVFSQFLGFLDLMEQSFRSGGIPFARLDGKLSLKERVKVLEQFGKAQPKSADVGSSKKIGSVLLVSMKAGGVGLNLVAANSVFM